MKEPGILPGFFILFDVGLFSASIKWDGDVTYFILKRYIVDDPYSINILKLTTMKKLIPLLFFLFCGVTTFWGQTIRYVKSVPSGLGDGSSWENASGDLLLMVNISSAGDFVWVAEGVYSATASPTSSFEMKDGVTLLGGFPAMIPGTLDDRDPMVYPSVLNAVGERRVLKFPSPSLHPTICDGFVLQGGVLSQYQGGGVYLTENAVLRHCIIRDCVAAQGGGIYFFNGGLVDFCVVEKNEATLSGGGVLINQNGSLQHCVVRSNQAQNIGGVGVEIQGEVLNCVISNNTAASSSGGLYVSGNTTVINCSVVKNKAEGAVGEQVLTNAKVYNSAFWGNVPLMTQSESPVSDCAIEGWLQSDENIVLSTMNNDSGAPSPWFKQPSFNAGHQGDFDGLADWSLTKQSALVNQGSNNWVPASLDLDLAGFQRIYDDVVDVGAFELQEKLSTSIVVPELSWKVSLVANQLVVDGLLPGRTVLLFNASGQLIGRKVAGSRQLVVDAGALAPGLYFIKCGHRVHKFVKQ